MQETQHTWTFEEFVEEQTTEVMAKIREYMNEKLSAGQRQTAKVALSDIKGRPARGVLFYQTNVNVIYGGRAQGLVFVEKFESMEYGVIFPQVRSYLNGLDICLAQNSQVVLADRRDGEISCFVLHPAG